jgi:hypothetical protein
VEVCAPASPAAGGAGDCQPFALTPPVNPEDERTTPIEVAVSASGGRLAVVRGADDGLTPVTLEVYDRAAGKRLGVVRPRSPCAMVSPFAGETAVFIEWRCTDEGSALLLVGPAGKQVARIPGDFPKDAVSARVDGDRWAFSSFSAISLYDVVSGKRLAVLPRRDEVFTVAHGKLHVFDLQRAELTSYDSAGTQLGRARAPTCRYEWETEALGPLALELPTSEVRKALGAPKHKTPPQPDDLYASRWTYAGGVTLGIEAANVDPNFGGPVLPFRVVFVRVTAPSALRTRAGIGIGSTFEEVMAAYGKHIVRTRSDADRFFVGNDRPNEPDGLVLYTTAGKVSKIELGSGGWSD